jgi:L-ascorbate metabolism protein UlaG (beta-lactamase superfamily)
MSNLRNSGARLIEEIEHHASWSPTLWWLGHAGFAVKYHSMIFYLDPRLAGDQGRVMESPLDPSRIAHADMVLASHSHPGHLDPLALPALLAASTRAKVVLPKSAAHYARDLGIEFHRMTSTDSGLRIEYFHSGDYIRVYAVPSAHPTLDYTSDGGYPYLGYLIRCGGCTLYHAGDCVPYEGLADRLRPFSVSVAMLPIDGRDPNKNFSIREAAQLAEDIGASWLVPMHYGTFNTSRVDIGCFIDHMLFHRPSQRFKVFECGESWTVPED